MKNIFTNPKFKRGSLAVTVTLLTVVAIIVLNVLFSAFAQRFGWYGDMTTEYLFSLSDDCTSVLRDSFAEIESKREEKGEEEVKVRILFCDDRDTLLDSSLQKYVVSTAEDLAVAFPDKITVDYVNYIKNPSYFQRYETQLTLNQNCVIVESGTEYRVFSQKAFFAINDDSEIWAYNGEQQFASAMLAVIVAERPIACLTTNHGEEYYDTALTNLLVSAGFEVRTIDLVNEDIPEDCRLIITYNPQTDFLAKSSVSDISEIEKLDKFVIDSNSYMIFTNDTTPYMPNLETYLDEWGIVFDRHESSNGKLYNYMIEDYKNSLTYDGRTLVARYETAGLGSSLTSLLRDRAYPPKVVFRNATSISVSKNFTRRYNEEKLYTYYSNTSGAFTRDMYSVFTAHPTATAKANGVAMVSDPDKLYSLMTITRENHTKMVDTDSGYSVSSPSYVVACSSTDFASREMLESVYGNEDVLLYAFQTFGAEILPAGIDIKPFDDRTIDTLTTSDATTTTVLLTVIPVTVVLLVGILVIVRRKTKC